jgi:hypothetical protein
LARLLGDAPYPRLDCKNFLAALNQRNPVFDRVLTPANSRSQPAQQRRARDVVGRRDHIALLLEADRRRDRVCDHGMLREEEIGRSEPEIFIERLPTPYPAKFSSA